MATKKRPVAEYFGELPKSFDDSPFYGLQLDNEQLHFANTVINPDIDIVFVNAKAGTGKAQPLDTKIPTPNGVVDLGDIKVGDYVFDANGAPTKVLGVFKQGRQRAYRVTLSDGRSTICAGEHLWSYYPPSGVLLNKLVTETLNSMMQRSLRCERVGAANRYAIPLTKPVQYSEKLLPVDPYVVGAFLGDGCCTERSLTISSNDVEIVNDIASLIGCSARKINSDNYSWNFQMNADTREKQIKLNDARKDIFLMKTGMLFKEIPELIGKCTDKRIPNIYKTASIEQRYNLLQGLFDTDGSIVRTGSKYSVRYTSINKGLVQDIVEIIYSLGYCATITERYREDKKNTEYSIYARVPNSDKHLLFRTERKKRIALSALKCDNYRKYDRTQIVDIEDLGYECDMVCIYVDNDDHLYLTNDYIVTHNTTIAAGVANILVQYGVYNGIVYIMSPYGERKQGWLPGTITEKSSVYFEAFYQALVTCNINPQTAINDESMVNQKNGTGFITCITDTFLRGSNLDNVVVIIDEAQNYSVSQLKKTLTRVGKNVKVIVIGHELQCDLDNPGTSGFAKYIEHFKGKERAAVCELTTNHRGWISQCADELEET